MIIDCTYATDEVRLDVTRSRHISLMVNPGASVASTAVIEVKRCFGTGGPSASFATAQTLVLDSSAALDINVEDTAWVALAVTTAESGVSVEVDYRLSGSMVGDSGGPVAANLDALGRSGSIPIRNTGYKAFILADPSTTISSAVARIDRTVGSGYLTVPATPASNLTIDGATITEVDCAGVNSLDMVVTTLQADTTADIYWYVREESPIDSASPVFLASLAVSAGTINATPSDLVWDTTDISEGMAYTRSGSTVTLERAGTYSISCDVSVQETSSSSRNYYEVTALVNGSVVHKRSIYARLGSTTHNSCTVSWAHVAAAGDAIKFQCKYYSGTIVAQYYGGGCSLSITKTR